MILPASLFNAVIKKSGRTETTKTLADAVNLFDIFQCLFA